MQYRYLLAGALATSAAAFSNTTDTEPQTVTEIGSTIHTVITITSCEDNKCNEKTVPATHSIVTKTIDSVETVYTTLCPIETGEQETQPAPAPGPTGEQGQPHAEGEKTTEGQPPAPAPTGEQGQGQPPAPAAPENNNNESQPPAPAPTGNASEGPAPHSTAPAPAAPEQGQGQPPAPAAPAAPENNNNQSQPPAPAPTSAAEETKAPAPAPTGNASEGPAPHSTAPGEQGPAPVTTATTVAGPEKSAPVQEQQQQSSAPGVPEVSGAFEGAANANKLGFAMGAIGLIAALL